MRLVILTIALVATVASAASLYDSTLDNFWTEFKLKHNKLYQTIEEENARRLTWEANLKKIQTHNLRADMGHHTYKLGMNQFGDMTNEEVNQSFSYLFIMYKIK
jgi:cathepsin L